jgi:hypothetical protein
MGAAVPDVDIRADGTAMLEATVYARAGEECIERRMLLLAVVNELLFYGRGSSRRGGEDVRVATDFPRA